ncbi:hypothetical protein K1719_017595 [Acacia pycnantha]|nr:hypothetical protein K1719_017595 [Acacia pycnantha]
MEYEEEEKKLVSVKIIPDLFFTFQLVGSPISSIPGVSPVDLFFISLVSVKIIPDLFFTFQLVGSPISSIPGDFFFRIICFPEKHASLA